MDVGSAIDLSTAIPPWIVNDFFNNRKMGNSAFRGRDY